MIFSTLRLREEKRNTNHIFEGSGANFITQHIETNVVFCATKNVWKGFTCQQLMIDVAQVATNFTTKILSL